MIVGSQMLDHGMHLLQLPEKQVRVASPSFLLSTSSCHRISGDMKSFCPMGWQDAGNPEYYYQISRSCRLLSLSFTRSGMLFTSFWFALLHFDTSSIFTCVRSFAPGGSSYGFVRRCIPVLAARWLCYHGFSSHDGPLRSRTIFL